MSTQHAPADASPLNENSTLPVFEGHPRALPYLFGAEMWERFSYYGMRALLVLYLTKHLQYEEKDALQVYGWYTSLVYLTPLIGGYLADRYLGARRAIMLGGIIMALGHFAMAFESLLYPALALLIVGNGFFKPNISTLVGSLYKEGDARRDGGFTLFYMGINIGGALSPLVCGWLGEVVGWHYGFGAAGVGMIFGLWFFSSGQHLLGSAGLVPSRSDDATSMAHYAPFTREDWQRMFVIAFLSMGSIFFWSAFEQAGGTMTLFADQSTRRELLGFTIPASFFQSINGAFIILLAPFFSMMWIGMARKGHQISSGAKFSVGLVLVGLSFVLMAVATTAASAGPVSPLWLVAVYFIQTVGELCISPVGLSTVTKLAHPRTVGFMMGLWFGCSAVGNWFAGFLTTLLEGTGIDLNWFLVCSAGGTGIAMALMVPLLKKWSHGRDE